jgi:hypothetical protein
MNLWPVLAAGSGLVVVLFVPMIIGEVRRERAMASTGWITGYEEPTLRPEPVPDWRPGLVVAVPGLDPGPRKRYVSGAGRKLAGHQRAAATAWLWDTPPGPAIPAVGVMAANLRYSGWGWR